MASSADLSLEVTSTPRKPINFWNKSARFWFLAAFGWTMIAIIAASSAFVALKGQSYVLWSQLFSRILIYYYLWALLSPLAYLMVTRLPFKITTAPWIIMLHIGFLALTGIGMPMLVHYDNWQDWVHGERAIAFHTMNAISYCFVLIACLVVKYYQMARRQEREARELSLHNLKLENQLHLARLDSLKMQINPHFLFNALNSIGALVETKRNDEAYETVETLGALLRHALLWSSEQQVPLSNELAFIDLYLSIERLRYGERLCYNHFITPDSMRIAIPALILQPLVENSIKHAVAATTRPVHIVLRTRLVNGQLLIDVEDDGPSKMSEVDTHGVGIGLQNVRERLQLLYGESAQLEVTSGGAEGGRGFAVHIRLPAQNYGASHMENDELTSNRVLRPDAHHVPGAMSQ